MAGSGNNDESQSPTSTTSFLASPLPSSGQQNFTYQSFSGSQMTETTASMSTMTTSSNNNNNYGSSDGDIFSTNSSISSNRNYSSSFFDDDDTAGGGGGGGSRDFRELKRYSNDLYYKQAGTAEYHQKQQFLLPTPQEHGDQDSAYNDEGNDGTFLKKDWLDIPSTPLVSSPNPCCWWCPSTTIMTLAPRLFRNINTCFRSIEKNAVHFGFRMSVLLTISSIFVFAEFKEGMWVLITVLFVCWFPRLDSASVVEKSIQRLIGTFIGAALALSCGFFSLWLCDLQTIHFELEQAAAAEQDGTLTLNSGLLLQSGDKLSALENEEEQQTLPQQLHNQERTRQAIFLGTCIFIVTFVVGFFIIQHKIEGVSVIQKYNYASILCLLTFAICIFPFYDGDDPKWITALYRIQNVIIGCILGAFGSMVIAPKSTTQILTEQIHRQIRLAGEASEAVLHAAADSFCGALDCIDMADELLETPLERSKRIAKQSSRTAFAAVKKEAIFVQSDKVLGFYESALKDWRVTKEIFTILEYDPFNVGVPEAIQKAFKREIANTLARSLRIQTTVVLLDGIVRNDPKHDFSDDDLELVADSGSLIHQMLTVPLHSARSEDAALELTEKLHQIRQLIVRNAGRVAQSPDELPSIKSHDNFELLMKENNVDDDDENDDDYHGRGTPKFVKGSNVCALLFLQLVEHLILRSLRLYNSWKRVELIRAKIKTF